MMIESKNEEKNKLKELLKVIDIEVCEISEDSITIKDLLYPNEFNEVLTLPISEYKTRDELRIFKSSYIEKNNYHFSVLNTKYPKIPFNKNGVEFNITISKTKNKDKDEEKFNLELFYNGIACMLFMGKEADEEYICFRMKDKEWIDFSYVINPNGQKFKREMMVGCGMTSSSDFKGITVINNNEESYISIKTPTLKKHAISSDDVEKYFNAIAFKLRNTFLKIIEVIKQTNPNFIDIIINDFPIGKELINLSKEEVEEEEVNSFFDKYLNIVVSSQESEKIMLKKYEQPKN